MIVLIIGTCKFPQIASVRRSLFNNAERGKFLNQLVTGVREILQNPNGLQDPNNYHEFCRSVIDSCTCSPCYKMVSQD